MEPVDPDVQGRGRVEGLLDRVGDRAVALWLPMAVLVVSGLKVLDLSIANIHWDEFRFLSRVHEYLRGDLYSFFQTFHVHLFAWLGDLPGTEVDQIVAARVVAHLAIIGALICAYLLGRRLIGREGAWFALLATISHAYFLLHGGSFRADSFITFLSLLAMTLLVYRPGRWWAGAAAGLAIALATLVSIKTIFYLPTLAAIWLVACWSGPPRKALLTSFSAFVGAGAATYLVLLRLHAAAVGGDDTAPHRAGGALATITGRLLNVGQDMWGETQWGYLEWSLVNDAAFWLLGFCGLLVAIHWIHADDHSRRSRGVLLLGLALPVLTLLFYRNSFPYYYVTFVPLLALLAGLAVQALCDRFGGVRGGALVLVATAPFLWNAHHHYSMDDATTPVPLTLAPQRQLVDTVHTLFPEPVPYIGRAGMVASHPRVGPFMSTLVLARYRAQGPSLVDHVAREQPVFLLANIAGLHLERDWEEMRGWGYRLLRDDFVHLQEHYIHHWGPIWVAGKRLTLAADRPAQVNIPVRAQYTVEAETPVNINGRTYRNGDTVRLHGHTEIGAIEQSGEVVLRYGENLPVPDQAPPGRLFRGLL